MGPTGPAPTSSAKRFSCADAPDPNASTSPQVEPTLIQFLNIFIITLFRRHAWPSWAAHIATGLRRGLPDEREIFRPAAWSAKRFGPTITFCAYACRTSARLGQTQNAGRGRGHSGFVRVWRL